MKFDTRDSKPKLYHLLFEAVVIGVVICVLAMLDVNRYAAWISMVVSLYLLFAAIQLIVAFFRQMQFNPYSYNTIFYFGFALFLFVVFLIAAWLTGRILLEPDLFQAGTIVRYLVRSAADYMLFTFPFLLVFSVALCVSNISLIRHEGRRPVNLLGILLSFLLIGGALFLYRFDYYASGSEWEVMIHELIANFFAAVYLYFECMILGVIVAGAVTARYEPDPDKDFLIVLGCGLRADGTPTPLLQGRLDRALAFAEKQRRQTGMELTFVTSGGQGPDEAISESTSMKQYLMDHGVPASRIIEEDQSTSTFENMKFSREKILAVNPGGKVSFSTTNYHVFRSGLFARRVKMRAVGMGAETKWYFWPNAAVREFVGLVTEHRLKQGIILVSLIVFYLVLTVLSYQLMG